jgi:hypothetical protein
MPTTDNPITAAANPRCGVNLFSSRIAVARKSRDLSGACVMVRIDIRIGPLTGAVSSSRERSSAPHPDRLRVRELGILRTVCEQRPVRAGSDDTPVVDYHDLVGIDDGRNTL